MAHQLDLTALEYAITDLRGDGMLLELARASFVDDGPFEAKVLQADHTTALLHAIRRVDDAVRKVAVTFHGPDDPA